MIRGIGVADGGQRFCELPMKFLESCGLAERTARS